MTGQRFKPLAAALLCWPGGAWAHSFAQPYQLPMPYWMYIYAAVAALVLSFLIVGWFVTAGHAHWYKQTLNFGEAGWLQRLRRWRIRPILQGLSLALLLLCILTGLFGTIDSYRNFNMTFFWLVFALGFAYLTALLGDSYAVLSPWRVLSALVGRFRQSFQDGLIRYPRRLAYWPAVGFYMGFIWLELLGNTRPFSLSIILLIYTGINLAGVWLIGARDWFRYCEFFAVFMRLMAKIAPIEYRPDVQAAERFRLRWPCAGILQEPIKDFSLLIFVLFMLSSTAFDGLRETVVWFNIFWKDPSGLFTWLLGEHPIYTYGWSRPWYFAYETLWIIASPFIYLAAFWLFVWLGKCLTRTELSTRELALRFGLTLLPIVLVYHITHYYTMLLSQGLKIRALISDPFGWGWDLFGTAYTLRSPVIPDMGFVWNSQVWLILLGHVLSVYLAHVVALQTFASRRQATISQLPMLVLMVLFTGAGLWILAQPLQGR
ncbi:MAG: hypothetical protein ACPHER_03335 [Nevskiales bacterium]